jgi:hypothetical protein
MNQGKGSYPPKWLKIVTLIVCVAMLIAALAADTGVWVAARWIMAPLALVTMSVLVMVCPTRPEIKARPRLTFFAAVLLVLYAVNRL